MKDTKFEDDYQNYVNLSSERRGIIINETIMLERTIDKIIASHFCESKAKINEIMQLILCNNRMTFENKNQVLKVIIEKHYSSFINANPTAINDINKIIEYRNIFAHYWLVTSKDLSKYILDKQTVFVKLKNEKKYIIYNENDIVNILHLINKTIKVFRSFKFS